LAVKYCKLLPHESRKTAMKKDIIRSCSPSLYLSKI